MFGVADSHQGILQSSSTAESKGSISSIAPAEKVWTRSAVVLGLVVVLFLGGKSCVCQPTPSRFERAEFGRRPRVEAVGNMAFVPIHAMRLAEDVSILRQGAAAEGEGSTCDSETPPQRPACVDTKALYSAGCERLQSLTSYVHDSSFVLMLLPLG